MNILKDLKKLTDPPPPITTPQEIRKKVLIVEDEKPLQEALAAALDGQMLEILTADNGQLGLEIAKSQKPNVVVLDLIMPVMDGKAMLHSMREIPELENIPVIVLTNAGTVDNIKETQRFDGASYFLIKSNVSMDEIVAKVKELL